MTRGEAVRIAKKKKPQKNKWIYQKIKWKTDKITVNHGRIYIYSHPQTDCFVVLQLITVSRHVGRLKLGSKPA